MIQRRPIVIDEAIAIRQMVFMPLSYDHRLIDGAVAAQFLNRIKHNLETWDFSPELAKVM
jgi:pyruvate/2-oxoglutarate dehydrogenase complex dihydrolipoamide acyltransferase (E2) component